MSVGYYGYPGGIPVRVLGQAMAACVVCEREGGDYLERERERVWEEGHRAYLSSQSLTSTFSLRFSLFLSYLPGKNKTRTFWDRRREELETLAASASSPAPAAGALRAPLKPAYLAFAALYAIAYAYAFHPPDDAAVVVAAGGVSHLSAGEVWWAIRDGYAGDLAAHLFRNGGLLVGDAPGGASALFGDDVAGVVVRALSPQEMFWSIRDGYAGNTLFSTSGVNGVTLEGGSSVVPFAPQEVWWAIKNGYTYDMIEHWFRNGGLLV